MAERTGGLLALVLLTTILPEMLSGNTPAEKLFRPGIFLFLAVAYGAAVLAIREWAVRLRLGAGGIFLAGLAYGLVNEGLFARTIFRETGMPIDLFDGYGLALGVNVAWALFIMVWHALASVLFPIVLSHQFFPAAAARPWLGRRTTLALAAAVALLASLFFLSDRTPGPPGTVDRLILLWLAIAALASLASLRGSGGLRLAPPAGRWLAFGFGAASLAPMIGLLLVVRARANFAVYALLFLALALLWVWLLRRQDWQVLPALGWVGLGWYTQMAAFGWISMVQRSPATAAIGALCLAAMIGLCLIRERMTTG
jgi:hypothetical protein